MDQDLKWYGKPHSRGGMGKNKPEALAKCRIANLFILKNEYSFIPRQRGEVARKRGVLVSEQHVVIGENERATEFPLRRRSKIVS